MGKLLPALLVASLAVNVFVLGAFGAHWFDLRFSSFRGMGMDGRQLRSSEMPPGRFHSGVIVGLPSPRSLFSVLTEDERERLTVAWRRENPNLREQFRAMYDARDNVADILKEENYQSTDLAEAFALLRSRQMELAATSQGLIVELAEGLDEEGRDRLAGILRPPPDRPFQRLRESDDKD